MLDFAADYAGSDSHHPHVVRPLSACLTAPFGTSLQCVTPTQFVAPKAKSKSMIPDAVCLLNRRNRNYLDPQVFGTAFLQENRWTPRHANPSRQPPQKLNYVVGIREPLALTRRQITEHIGGNAPCFQQNVSSRPREVWTESAQLALVGAFAAKMSLAEQDAALAVIDRGEFTLSVKRVWSMLRAHPFSRSVQKQLNMLHGDDPLRGLKRQLLLCDGERRKEISQFMRRDLTQYILEELTDHELVVDIDGDKAWPARTLSKAIALAEQIAKEIFRGVVVCIEPSRNRGGAYLRIRVQRQGASREFNAQVRRLEVYLKARYNGAAQGVRVDKVAGKLVICEQNPAFDRRSFHSHERWQNDPRAFTRGERYRWRKSHHNFNSQDGYAIIWKYDARLEPFTWSGSDLITFALHNLSADADGGAARLRSYQQMLESAPLAEAELAALVPSTHADHGKQYDERTSSFQTDISNRDHCLFPHRHSSDQRKLEDGRVPQHSRYMAAARIASRRCKGDVEKSLPIGLDLVEGKDGPATGHRHRGRVSQMRRCIQYAARTFRLHAPRATASQVKIDQGALLRLVRRRVSTRRLAEANAAGGRATYEAIASALELYVQRIVAGANVSQKQIRTLLQQLGMHHSNQTVAAIRKILTDDRNQMLVQARPSVPRTRAAGFLLHQRFPARHLITATISIEKFVAGFAHCSVAPGVEDVYSDEEIAEFEQAAEFARCEEECFTIPAENLDNGLDNKPSATKICGSREPTWTSHQGSNNNLFGRCFAASLISYTNLHLDNNVVRHPGRTGALTRLVFWPIDIKKQILSQYHINCQQDRGTTARIANSLLERRHESDSWAITCSSR